MFNVTHKSIYVLSHINDSQPYIKIKNIQEKIFLM